MGSKKQSSQESSDVELDIPKAQPRNGRLPIVETYKYPPTQSANFQQETLATRQTCSVDMNPIDTWQVDPFLDISGPEYSWMDRHGSRNHAPGEQQV